VGKKGFRVLAIDDDRLCLEPRRVVRAFATGRKPVYRLTTQRGRTVRATGNHKFFAFDGWRRLDDMGPGMQIAAAGELPGPIAVAEGAAYEAPIATDHWRPTTTVELKRTAASIATRAALPPPAASLETEVDWDVVVSIEPDGEDEVYDLTVEDLHSFVAEDIVVHNSLEQDADLVFFIYRDEYYNDETEAQGIAEIHLAKHRNGPTGTDKLAWLNRYAKFADLAPSG
jgi:replicative DNA helicase